jgi:hypothetical protein
VREFSDAARNSAACRQRPHRVVDIQSDWTPSSIGTAVALQGVEPTVFRTVLAAIVVTVALGQSAGLLCAAWCPAAARAMTGCVHEERGTPAAMISGGHCGEVVAAAEFIREEALGSSAIEPAAASLRAFQLTSLPLMHAMPAAQAGSAPLAIQPPWSPLRI